MAPGAVHVASVALILPVGSLGAATAVGAAAVTAVAFTLDSFAGTTVGDIVLNVLNAAATVIAATAVVVAASA